MTQTFDFAPIKASETSLKPLPWGRYAAAIESLEIVTSKTGKEMVQITTSLLGPKQFEGALLENKKLWFYIILGNEKTSEKFAKVAAACNIAQTEFTDNDIHETVKNGILEGSTVSVQINTELFEGEKVNKICAFYTIESMLALKN